MKNFIFLFTLLAAMIANRSSAMQVELFIEEVENNDLGLYVTYRIYAMLDDPQGSIHAVYGDANHPMSFAYQNIYQNQFGGQLSKDINPALFGIAPELAFDSWFTIGYENNSGNTLNQVGIDFGNFTYPNETAYLTVTNGSWYLLPDDPKCYPDDRGLILLGQVTFGDYFQGTINMQGWDGDHNVWQVTDIPIYTDDASDIDAHNLVVHISSYSSGMTLNCGEEIPTIQPTVIDSCGPVTYEYEKYVIGNTAYVDWVLYDDCNYENWYQTFNLNDISIPTYPDNTVTEYWIECGAAMPPPPAFTDVCDDQLDIVSEAYLDNDILYVTWTATNNFLQQTEVFYTIHQVCCGYPQLISGSSNLYFECVGDVEIPTPVFYDPNDQELDITQVVDSFSNDCGYELYITWTATNDCGLTESSSLTVTVYDDIHPSFPEDTQNEYWIGCDGSMPNAPAFYDNCDNDVLVYNELNIEGDITYIFWTAVDDCGNYTNFSMTVHTESCCNDPMLSSVISDLFLNCDEETTFTTPEFFDVNESPITVGHDYYQENLDCGFIIHHTWTATNECGGSTTVHQNVYVSDNDQPYYPAETQTSYELACGSEYPAAPAFSDNCDNNLSVTDELFVIDTYHHLVVWTATDDCGNSFSVTYEIFFNCCNYPQVMNEPADVVVECGDELIAPDQPTFYDPFDAELTIQHTEVQENLDCGFIIHHVWTATNDCGLDAVANVDVIVTDNTAPTFLNFPQDLFISCSDEIPAPAAISATDACDDQVMITTEIVEGDSDECGNTSFTIYYTATDNCGNTAYHSYIIQVVDNTEPTLNNCPSDITLNCGEELPTPANVLAEDNCDESPELTYDQFVLGDLNDVNAGESCALLTPIRPLNNPCGYPVNWSMCMFALPKLHRYYYVSAGSYTQMNDGTVLLTATMNNVYNPNNGWNIQLTFGNEMNWNEWSNQSTPHSFKGDCGGEGINHTSWLYYILQNTAGAEMTGFGAYAGSSMNTYHTPANNYFGFQYGDGANNYNGVENGFGGWFRYSGTMLLNGVGYGSAAGNIAGSGDLAFELDCCAAQEIIRQWTATDCSGNTTSCIQHITIGGENASANNIQNMPPMVDDEIHHKGNFGLNVFPNPSSLLTTFRFTAEENTHTKIEVFDLTGSLIGVLFDNETDAGIGYAVEFDTSEIASGIYMYNLKSGNDLVSGKLVVTH